MALAATQKRKKRPVRNMLQILRLLVLSLLVFFAPFSVKGECDGGEFTYRHEAATENPDDDYSGPTDISFVFDAKNYQVYNKARYPGSAKFVQCQKLWAGKEFWIRDAEQHNHINHKIEDRWGISDKGHVTPASTLSFEGTTWKKLYDDVLKKLRKNKTSNEDAAEEWLDAWNDELKISFGGHYGMKMTEDGRRRNSGAKLYGSIFHDLDKLRTLITSKDATLNLEDLSNPHILINEHDEDVSKNMCAGTYQDEDTGEAQPSHFGNEKIKLEFLLHDYDQRGEEIEIKKLCENDYRLLRQGIANAMKAVHMYRKAMFLRFQKVYARASMMGVNMVKTMRECGMIHLLTSYSPKDLEEPDERTSLDGQFSCEAEGNETADWLACNSLLDAYDVSAIADKATGAIQNFDNQSKQIDDQSRLIEDPLNPTTGLDVQKKAVERMKRYAAQRAGLSAAKMAVMAERISSMPTRQDIKDFTKRIYGENGTHPFGHRNLLDFQKELQKHAKEIACKVDDIIKSKANLAPFINAETLPQGDE